MSDNLSGLSVSVTPDLDGFNEKARRGLADASKDLGVSAGVTADTRQAAKDLDKLKANASKTFAKAIELTVDGDTTDAAAKVDDLKSKALDLASQIVDMKFGADDAGAIASIDELAKKSRALADQISDLKFSADTAGAVTSIDALDARTDALADKTADIKVNVQGTEAQATLARLMGETETLSDTAADIRVGIDDDSAVVKVAALKSELYDLNSSLKSLTIDGDDRDLVAKLAAARAMGAGLAERLSNIPLSVDVDSSKFLRAESQVAAFAAKAGALLDVGNTYDVNVDTSKALGDLGKFDVEAATLAKAGGDESGKSFLDGFDLMSPQVLVPVIVGALAVAPGLFAIAGAAGAVAFGTALAYEGSPAIQKAAKGLLGDLESTMEGAASVLDKPIMAGIAEIQGQLPEIGQLFSETFADAAPLIKPLVTMLDEIVEGALPGLNSLLKESEGPLSSFFTDSGKIVGSGLDRFFTALAPGVSGSLTGLEGLETVAIDVAVDLAKVGTAISQLITMAKNLGDQVTTVNPTLAQTGTALHIPKGNENIFSVFKDGYDWLSKNAPGGNKTILDLASNTGQAATAAGNQASKQNALNAALQQSVSAEETAQGAMNRATALVTAQTTAVQTLDTNWTRYFALLGNSQSALSTILTDVTSVTSAIKQYGSGSLQANAAVAQMINDNETLVQGLQAQDKAAGNTTAAQKLMTGAFLDTANGELSAASNSKPLQNALVDQAEQLGINITTWPQLKALIEKSGGTMNGASKDANDLSDAQQANTSKTAAMSQAHSDLVGTLAKEELQGGLNKAQVSDLTSAMAHNTDGVDDSKAAFDRYATSIGISTKEQNILWAAIKNTAGTYKANVVVSVTGGGKVNVAAQVSLSDAGSIDGTKLTGNNVYGANGSLTYAAGGIVPGGIHGKDSVPAMLAPGELVVPTAHVPHVAALMKSKQIPGFASGGLITANSAFSQAASVGSSLSPLAEPAFANAIGNQTANAVGNALKTGLAQAQESAAAGTNYTGSSSFGGGFESLAALVSFAKYFMENGLTAIAAAGMAATISGEENSFGPESRNCVPLTYKVVTLRGILAHDEVRAGDQVPGFNLETQREEIATILDVPYHYDAEMCRIGNAHWSVTCTVDHKWITERGLIRADRLLTGEKILLGDGWSEVVHDYERLENQDTFCLTTTTGTWTVVTDEGDTIWTGNSDGFGLIGWTNNTVGLPAGYTGPTGNVAYDLAEQLKGVIGYMNAKGGAGPLNAASNPVEAGDIWSRYEGPLNPLSDTRAEIANEIYAQLKGSSTASDAVTQVGNGMVSTSAGTYAQGGLVPPSTGGHHGVRPFSTGGVINEPVAGVGAYSGMGYSFAENGPEIVSNAGQAAAAGNPGMQGATNISAQAMISLLQTIVKQNQQLPNVLGKAIGGSGRSGVQHGFYKSQN